MVKLDFPIHHEIPSHRLPAIQALPHAAAQVVEDVVLLQVQGLVESLHAAVGHLAIPYRMGNLGGSMGNSWGFQWGCQWGCPWGFLVEKSNLLGFGW